MQIEKKAREEEILLTNFKKHLYLQIKLILGFIYSSQHFHYHYWQCRVAMSPDLLSSYALRHTGGRGVRTRTHTHTSIHSTEINIRYLYSQSYCLRQIPTQLNWLVSKPLEPISVFQITGTHCFMCSGDLNSSVHGCTASPKLPRLFSLAFLI